MCSRVNIGGKVLKIQETMEKLNNIGLDAIDFSDASHVYDLKYPFEVAIKSDYGCKSFIQGFFQEIAESEAV